MEAFNIIFETAQFPTGWLDSTIYAVSKNEMRLVLKTADQLSLKSCMRVLSTALAQRLELCYILEDNQSGFRSGAQHGIRFSFYLLFRKKWSVNRRNAIWLFWTIQVLLILSTMADSSNYSREWMFLEKCSGTWKQCILVGVTVSSRKVRHLNITPQTVGYGKVIPSTPFFLSFILIM